MQQLSVFYKNDCLLLISLLSLFCNTALRVLSRFAILSLGKRRLVALLLLCPCCRVTDGVLCLFLAVTCVGLWYVIVSFPGDTHLLFVVGNLGSAVAQ